MYEYGAVPPEIVANISPSLSPLHVTLLTLSTTATTAELGCVIVIGSVSIQPLLSTICKVYVPAAKLGILNVPPDNAIFPCKNELSNTS